MNFSASKPEPQNSYVKTQDLQKSNVNAPEPLNTNLKKLEPKNFNVNDPEPQKSFVEAPEYGKL